MAKISFNYFARVNGTGRALRPQYDAARRFVRYCEEPEYSVVEADLEEIFKVPGETPAGMRQAIHILTVERPTNVDAVIGQVSLFGGVRYQIALSTQPEPSLVVSGHVFNPADCRIYELGRRPRK